MRQKQGQDARGKEQEEADLFRQAVRDVVPMRPANRVEPVPRRPAPIPTKRYEDERAVLEELAHLATSDDVIEFEDDGVFLRPGLPRS